METELIAEGRAKIHKSQNAFYNEAQVVNRDLTVCVIATFAETINAEDEPKRNSFLRREKFLRNGEFDEKSEKIGLYILDALSATGIRSIRFAAELDFVRKVTANDLSQNACGLIERNIGLNDNVGDGVIRVTNCDANLHMATTPNEYNVIDLDPYGTAAPFIPTAVSSISDGGLLCVTSTDMRTLSGQHPETCWSNYGTMTIKGKYCHELALRILLSFIDRSASLHKRHIVPLASFSINFYVRVFVRVFKTPSETRKSCTKNGMAFICQFCGAFECKSMGEMTNDNKFICSKLETDSKCKICDKLLNMVGPIWLDQLHNKSFLNAVLNGIDKRPYLICKDRVRSLIALAEGEIGDSFLYVDISGMCKILKCTVLSNKKFFAEIANCGYKASYSHLKARYLKTNAPSNVLWAIIQKHALETKTYTQLEIEQMPILAKNFGVNFCNKDGVDSTIKRSIYQNFHSNGQNWGPKKRAKMENFD